ncbi:bifunctional [glutamate--ammonia ligase]-adenylyl-L-tyrosine phosphorylase/[glutamate--ammonia-ligase] adenylyltransferase [Sphingosinicella sp. BN140058]|uniref:bifunctional [glutamate--ammonia ligase]-adenylyl-L-tyrosine phosphorylase/[glutamate--ammonia-ligase] adenylyltransferase n=1 Tax=Sphingosinicella sp. BN140058 TaxID=1892855 RepID=UPI001012702D|nr:bifunctional [glutamate--ammonia ligase]-adenylyl-L-tyrosine phosphorylase/[glutamate--ammonia-ligase] adenylyltransferase [Sphingosinicella sp. BN140058]QAY79804.1 bifunctional [glutamate--ammonia ligase]-adenylyl-L-tyrosine phosphorylase/[glutamate--ammonia-ligase] adenylyltransferase [Sphingosinicella sp. BN140058]
MQDALARARRHSPFLRLQLDRFPAVATALETGTIVQAVQTARGAGVDAPSLAAALRRERSALATALAIGDLAGLIPFEALVAELSDLADKSLHRAIEAAILERTPDAEPRGFTIIALGKHGSRELNYSSDIDPLFLFDPATLPLKPREEPGQAAVRIGQRVIELIQKRDGEGYVFRIDLRLRPSSEVTPIALPVDAAISYYESSALPWERAAFIRARHAAGDVALGRYFLDAIHPFVWRRSLDFGAIEELQSITRRIRDHYSQGQKFGPGYDLKRGRGGIREVEFFAQIHQLIHGGREPGLRARATLDALAALAADARISSTDAADMADAYRLFRTIEHRLQMVDDRQTHSLPADPAALDNVARLHGLEDGASLLALLRPQVDRVAAVYTAMAGDQEEHLPLVPEALEVRLAEIGFASPAEARGRVDRWRSGKARSLRTAPAREAFEAMLPLLLEAFARAPDPMRAMNRFEDVLERLPSGVNFYRLLQARPGLTEHLAEILSHAPTLADQLARRPELLDGLIDASAFDLPPPLSDLIAEFVQAERKGEDYQMILDRVRRLVNERRFALGVQLVTGRSQPLDVTTGYARVAEAALNVLADVTIAEFEKRHGKVPGSELLILALGRFGGEALTHASDLDLVYLFSGTHEAESDGEKPLRATDYFNRLAPRVTAALSVPTAAGPLYEVDTRLRPSGKDGLLAVSVESFERYQREQAWTWEHLALLRARPIYGSPAARAELAAVIDRTLRLSRDPGQVTAEAVRMRRDIALHKQAGGPFDIKLGEGGLVDLEFAVHTLQLRTGIGLDPHLEVAIEALCRAGLVRQDSDEALRLLISMLVMFRLVSPSSAEPAEASRPLVARACGLPDWQALLAAHAQARQSVSELWRNVAAAAAPAA